MQTMIRLTAPRLMAAMLAVLFLASPVPAGAFGSDPADSASSRYKDAVAAVKSADYRRAIRLLGEVLDGDARNADALNYMGYSLRKLGDFDRALAYYQRALGVNPDHKGANEYIGETYLALKQPARAKVHLDRLARICGPGCEEYQDLKKAFDAFVSEGKHS